MSTSTPTQILLESVESAEISSIRGTMDDKGTDNATGVIKMKKHKTQACGQDNITYDLVVVHRVARARLLNMQRMDLSMCNMHGCRSTFI